MGAIVKISIIHFAPLEFYPPIQNLIIQLSKRKEHLNVNVHSTRPAQQTLAPFLIASPDIKLLRIAKSGAGLTTLQRYGNYLRFYLTSLFFLIRHRPTSVLYFETISSWPVWVYKRFFNKKCKIFIHYHEYSAPTEYAQGMILTRYFHRLEKEFYPYATWVSHTNEGRMDRFKKDLSPVSILNPHIIPNFPPKTWQRPAKHELNSPVKIVYVGALSLTTMYTKEFSKWVVDQKGKVVWDIFSYNHSAEAIEYIQSLPVAFVRMHHGVAYDQLPDLLAGFDVGVILYNGHIPNYVYNAPNKLFEYLACGLSVWFPLQMTGAHEYKTERGFPKVVSVDFADFGNFDLAKVLKTDGVINPPSFFCEDALLPLVDKLMTQ